MFVTVHSMLRVFKGDFNQPHHYYNFLPFRSTEVHYRRSIHRQIILIQESLFPIVRTALEQKKSRIFYTESKMDCEDMALSFQEEFPDHAG